MGASKNRGTPKWMVKIMENPIRIDDLGVSLFWKHPYQPICRDCAMIFFNYCTPLRELAGLMIRVYFHHC